MKLYISLLTFVVVLLVGCSNQQEVSTKEHEQSDEIKEFLTDIYVGAEDIRHNQELLVAEYSELQETRNHNNYEMYEVIGLDLYVSENDENLMYTIRVKSTNEISSQVKGKEHFGIIEMNEDNKITNAEELWSRDISI